MYKNAISGLLAVLLLLPALALAVTYPIPENGDVVGEVYIIHSQYEDTLIELARKHDLGYYEMVNANPRVDPWLPGRGTKIIVPRQYILPDAPREGIVINLAELRLYYYDTENNTVTTHPIGIGTEWWPTPMMEKETIIGKQKDPSWHVPQSILREHEAKGQPIAAVWPPGPDNPLGQYALRTSKPGYLIHGTNRPVAIGRRVTHGCIRMFPEDIEQLYYKVPVGATVRVVHQPIKKGWDDEKLYVEVHEPLEGYPLGMDDLLFELMAISEQPRDDNRTYIIDWDQIKQLDRDMSGIPQPIGTIQ